MKTKYIFLSLVVLSALLACSFFSGIFTKETDVSSGEVSTEQSPDEGENMEPIVGTWKQVVFNGLTDKKNTYLIAGDKFGDYHYFSTATSGSPLQPAEIWRTQDGLVWERVGEPGMGKPDNWSLIFYNWQNHLYVAAQGDGNASLWKSDDGETFRRLEGDWPEENVTLKLHAIQDKLILTVDGPVVNNNGLGIQIWSSIDGEHFEKVYDPKLDNPADYTDSSFNELRLETLKGYTYLGIFNRNKGGEIWRTRDGSTWETAANAGIDDPHNLDLYPIYSDQDYLYVLGINVMDASESNSLDLFRTADGEQWQKVVDNGFGLGQQAFMGWMKSFKGTLYLVTNNDDPRRFGFSPTGFRLWKSPDGGSWQQVGEPGFGYPNNFYAVINPIRGVFYLVTINYQDGNQVWRSTDGKNWEKFFTAPASTTNMGAGIQEYADSLLYIENDTEQGIQIWRYGP